MKPRTRGHCGLPIGSPAERDGGYGQAAYTPLLERSPIVPPSSPVETPDLSRGARLEARISAAQKALLQRAAALSGRTLSEFVVASAHEAASKVIAEHAVVQLSRAEQIAFVSTLLDPPKPSARLRRAAAAYRRQMGL